MPEHDLTTSASLDKKLKSGIYAIRHKATGKAYVGSAVNIKNRWRGHHYHLQARSHHSRPLQAAWNKYGADAFEWVVLEYVELDRLIEREQHYIDTYRSAVRGAGYNLCPIAGSCRGVKHSEESCIAKRARRHRPDSIAKMRAAKSGFRHTEETKRKMRLIKSNQPPRTPEYKTKMSEALKGRVFSEEHKARLAEAGRGAVFTEERKAKIAAASQARREQISATVREYWRRWREERANENQSGKDRSATVQSLFAFM